MQAVGVVGTLLCIVFITPLTPCVSQSGQVHKASHSPTVTTCAQGILSLLLQGSSVSSVCRQLDKILVRQQLAQVANAVLADVSSPTKNVCQNASAAGSKRAVQAT